MFYSRQRSELMNFKFRLKGYHGLSSLKCETFNLSKKSKKKCNYALKVLRM